MIEFHRPATAIAPLKFGLTGDDFKATFKRYASADPRANAPIGFADLMTALLDSGYGASMGIPAPLRARVEAFQQSRLDQLKALLASDPATGHLLQHDVAAYLEASDKSDAAYILGVAACRHAAGVWLAIAKGRTLRHFWHYALVCNGRVSRMSFAPVKEEGGKVPDFLAQDSAGQWYAFEAKGTFGQVGWATLRDGLEQATQLKSLTYFDAVAGQLRLNAAIADATCSQAWFARKDGALRITHVDPPVEPGGPGEEGVVSHVEFVPELVRLAELLEATGQVRALGTRSRELVSRRREAAAIRWHVLAEGTTSRQRVYVGMPEYLLRASGFMRDVSDAAGEVVGVLSSHYRSEARGDEREGAAALRRLLDRLRRAMRPLDGAASRRATRAASIELQLLAGLHESLRSTAPSANPVALSAASGAWCHAIDRLLEVRFRVSPEQAGTSVRSLLRLLEAAIERSRVEDVGGGLPPGVDRFAWTLRGLVVASRSPLLGHG